MKFIIAAVLLVAIIISYQWANSGREEVELQLQQERKKLSDNQIALESSLHEIRRLEQENSALVASNQAQPKEIAALNQQNLILQNQLKQYSQAGFETGDLKKRLQLGPSTTLPSNPQSGPQIVILQNHLGSLPNHNSLIDKIDRKLEYESDPLAGQLDGQLYRHETTIQDILANANLRMAIQKSPLAREVIAAYQNDADAFAKAEADEPPHPYKPLSQAELDHIRQEIEHGVTAADLLADPYSREAAQDDPAFQELIDEAIRRNGK